MYLTLKVSLNVKPIRCVGCAFRPESSLDSGDMKARFVMLIVVAAIACRKNPHIAKTEIAAQTGAKVDQILLQKKYQLDSTPSFEDIVLFASDNTTHLAVFTPADKGYSLLRQYNFNRQLIDPKLLFVAIGNRKSHILITHGGAEKTLVLFDAKNFMQEFTPKLVATASVKVTKTEEKPHDEMLSFGKENFRFNGIRWVPFQPDEIFPYVENFEAQGESSVIEIVNRGQSGSRVLLTIAFPELAATDIPAKLRLTKEISTVTLYKPGSAVHKNGGGNIVLAHPIIEIRKDSWQKNSRIKLPLFMQDTRRFTVRAVYSQRGRGLMWPASAGVGVTQDGQNYLAAEKLQ